MAIHYEKTPEQARDSRRSAPMQCKDNTFFGEIQIARFRVNISRTAVEAQFFSCVGDRFADKNLSLHNVGVSLPRLSLLFIILRKTIHPINYEDQIFLYLIELLPPVSAAAEPVRTGAGVREVLQEEIPVPV